MVKSISAGYAHTLALLKDGSVYAWGSNKYGRLGNNVCESCSAPIKVEGLSGIKSVSAGLNHSLALSRDGSVYAWGRNVYGQLGDGTCIDSFIPVYCVEGLPKIESISAGYVHSLALSGDGSVYGWGGNWYSQLSNDACKNCLFPVKVVGLPVAKLVSAGCFHSLALGEDGSVYAWGLNYYGQLGNGVLGRQLLPIRVKELPKIKSISAGDYHSLALSGDGSVYAWGWNCHGQLGDGNCVDCSNPVKVEGLSGIESISAGYAHTLALLKDGSVYAWGDNEFGQLGGGEVLDVLIALGDDGDSVLVPFKNEGLLDIKDISAGDCHSLALSEDGSVYAWGLNNYGQLGDGTRVDRFVPVCVKGLPVMGVKSNKNNRKLVDSLLSEKNAIGGSLL